MKTQVKNREIIRTDNFSQFKQDASNRDVRKNAPLEASLRTYGYLPEHPIVVTKSEGRLVIRDGGHRFSICKRLGIPVYYTIATNPSVAISTINEAQHKWSLEDFVSSFCNQGKEDYCRLRDYAQQCQIATAVAAELLSEGVSTPTQIKSGNFTFTSGRHAFAVMQLCNIASRFVPWAKQSRFIRACSAVIRFGGIDRAVLCEKIDHHASKLRCHPTTEGMIAMLENVYNYRNQNPVAVALNVKQSLKKTLQP